jgi:hemerythrin-like metal-binding protein
MEWIKWDKHLEVGHAAMDRDHTRLVALVNELADGVVNRSGNADYDTLLNDLLAHTEAHFRMEEQLMDIHNYPLADEHKSRHARLLRDAAAFKSRFDPAVAPSVSLLYFFEQWLTRHILASDKELAEFLRLPK